MLISVTVEVQISRFKFCKSLNFKGFLMRKERFKLSVCVFVETILTDRQEWLKRVLQNVMNKSRVTVLIVNKLRSMPWL